jgi:hypothetical protein
VLGKLAEAGYPSRVLRAPPGAGVVVGCQPGEGPAVWILAHTDSVHEEVPGAVDNAAAVGVALEVARRIRREALPMRVCFGFPDGEELGFYGSRVLAGHLEDPPALVIALELLGQGELTVTGLGPNWGSGGLRWLMAHVEVEIPYAYRVFSRILPQRERSDHAPFAAQGVPAFLLLGRGESGVYWPYHTASDSRERVEPEALYSAVDALISWLKAGPPEPGRDAAVVVPHTRVVLNGVLVWALVVTGILTGFLVGLRRWRDALVGLGWSLLATGGGWALLEVAAYGRPVHAALAEASHTTWMVGAGCILALSPQRPHGIAGGALVASWLSLGLLAFSPLLSLPFAVTALALAFGSRAWPFLILALPVPLYLSSGEVWRELVFHHLLPEGAGWWMPIRVLAWWPIVCAALSIRPITGMGWRLLLLGVVLVTALGFARMDPWAPPFPERQELRAR